MKHNKERHVLARMKTNSMEVDLRRLWGLSNYRRRHTICCVWIYTTLTTHRGRCRNFLFASSKPPRRTTSSENSRHGDAEDRKWLSMDALLVFVPPDDKKKKLWHWKLRFVCNIFLQDLQFGMTSVVSGSNYRISRSVWSFFCHR